MIRSCIPEKLPRILGTALILVVFASCGLAQSSRARIIGTVTDPQGAVVPKAAISVTNVATGVQTRAVTDGDGNYQALELPIGSYKVKVEKDGFTTTETTAYTLEINQVQRIDVRLKLGSASEVVEVTGEAAQVEVVNPTVGASITSRPIVDLPLNGRNVLDLALLQPGVTPHNNDDTEPVPTTLEETARTPSPLCSTAASITTSSVMAGLHAQS